MMLKNCIALTFSLGLVLFFGTSVFASQPKVYLGVAEQYMDQNTSVDLLMEDIGHQSANLLIDIDYLKENHPDDIYF
jgi:hypothetical protein